MTREQAIENICRSCPSHVDNFCGLINRNVYGRCHMLLDIMKGWEMGHNECLENIKGWLFDHLEEHISADGEFSVFYEDLMRALDREFKLQDDECG